MKILLISATSLESAMVRQHFDLPLMDDGEIVEKSSGELKINLLHTGIGMVNTAWHLGRAFIHLKPDLAIQFGIAGAFPGGPELLQVVEVVEDCFADLGADSPEGFIPLEKMGFANFRHANKVYYNQLLQPRNGLEGILGCKGITVNRVSGHAAGIAEMQQIWNPGVETMEGAAFFQACILEGIPFRAFRAISNRVEPRNRAAWRITEAIEAVQQHLISTLERVNQKDFAL